MIRLNLISVAERSAEMDASPVQVKNVTVRTDKRSGKKFMTVAVAALFVFVAFSCFISVAGVPVPLQGALPEAYLTLIGAEDPVYAQANQQAAISIEEQRKAAAEAAAKRREAMTVKDLVKEINPQALYNNKRADYNSFLPLEKVSFQRASFNQFMTFLTTATPEDVGFTDVIYQAPNYFYVRGASAKPNSQKSFLDRLKNVSTSFKTPPLPENAPATDITAFGQYNVTNANLAGVSKFVPAADFSAEVKAFKALVAENKMTLAGLDKPTVEDLGVYKRYAFQTSTAADFPTIQGFIDALSKSEIRMGIQKCEMKFVRKDLATSIRFEMLVLP